MKKQKQKRLLKGLKKSSLSPEIESELRDLVTELDARKINNPLYFHELLDMQEAFARDTNKTKCLFGGNRSGKSEGAADYVLKKGLEKPLKIWVVGETFQDSVAIQQTKIWQLVPKKEILYGNFDAVNGFTNRKLLLRNGTIFTFKSYDQGRKVFQSDDIDLVWNDEECPHDVYKEQRMRLIDRDGEMIISMTSLKGVTELIEEIFEDHEVIRSQYAELAGKDLPRIAKKGNFSFYFLWTLENKHISQKRTLEEAELMTRQEILSRFYGIPINLTGKIYMMMNRDIHVIPFEGLPEGHYNLIHILDPHDRKPWAMAWIAVHITGTAYVVEEYPRDKIMTEMESDVLSYEDYGVIIRKVEKHLKELFGVSVRRRIIDPNFGNKTVQLAKKQGGQAWTTPKKTLMRMGFHFKDGLDALEAGHLAVRSWLTFKRDEKTQEITKQPKLKFVDYCVNCITSMLRYSRKDPTTNDGDVKNKVGPKEKYKDHPDLVRYGVMSKLEYREEVKQEQPTGKAY